MMKKLMILAAISAASLAAIGAHAAVIYNGGGPDQSGRFLGEESYKFPAAAESFVLSTGANTVSGVSWWGICARTCPIRNFEVHFSYNDNSDPPDVPGALVNYYFVGLANQTATGNVLGLAVEYSYSTNIPALTLTPGTTYWVGITAITNIGEDGWAWETTSSGKGDGHAHYGSPYYFDQYWGVRPGDLAFNLTGEPVVAVPEPASLVLLGSSLLGFAVARRRKSKAG
jgi:hypothetical protein